MIYCKIWIQMITEETVTIQSKIIKKRNYIFCINQKRNLFFFLHRATFFRLADIAHWQGSICCKFKFFIQNVRYGLYLERKCVWNSFEWPLQRSLFECQLHWMLRLIDCSCCFNIQIVDTIPSNFIISN